jgi:glucosamine--fructose-6-phosphate aminotransferase (isomerizing)
MCGIVGVIGSKNPIQIIINGLKKLEYRGYDSAGIALIDKNQFKIIKEEGKIKKLESKIKPFLKNSQSHEIAIGHTRWATHGKPSKENAHPHASSKVCVVHNGIIENYQNLKKTLGNNTKFYSETDTEVLPHLIEKNYLTLLNLR